jgi:hypothetical protein
MNINFWSENFKVMNDKGNVDMDEKVMLKFYLKEIGCGLNLTGSGQDPVAGSCDHVNKTLMSREGGVSFG